MAGSVNKVILIGNLGADPEIRRTQDGRPIANLRIATSESLARQGHRRAPRKNRVAPRRHLQRGPVPDRRAVPEEGLEGLYRRPAADPQMAGPGRPGPLLDRGGAAGLQFRADMLDGRAGGGGSSDAGNDQGSGDFGSSGASSGRERKPAMAGGGRDDMDDEIPF